MKPEDKTAEDILKECKDEIARKWLYEDWADLRITLVGAKNILELPAMYDQASLLAMSKVAEQAYDFGHTHGAVLNQPLIGIFHPELKETPDKSTYLNNLFKKDMKCHSERKTTHSESQLNKMVE
jgi:hypothetical protein